jgi:hypothetical protein
LGGTHVACVLPRACAHQKRASPLCLLFHLAPALFLLGGAGFDRASSVAAFCGGAAVHLEGAAPAISDSLLLARPSGGEGLGGNGAPNCNGRLRAGVLTRATTTRLGPAWRFTAPAD